MRKVLLSLAVAALALPASAHRVTSEPFINFYANMNTLKAGGVWMDKDNSSAAWSVQSAPAGNIVTLQHDGIDYPAFEYTGDAPVTLTIRHARSTSPITNETGQPRGGIRWTDQIQYEVLVKRAADNANPSAIVPSFRITKTKFANAWTYNENSDEYEWTGSNTVNVDYKPTDGKTEVPVDGENTYVFTATTFSKNGQKSGPYPCTEDLYMFRGNVYTRYDIILTNIEKGDIVTVIRVDRGGAIVVPNKENGWVFPTLDYDKQGYKAVVHDSSCSNGSNSKSPIEIGELWIQAEDFDEPWINNRVACTTTLWGNPYGWRDAYGYYGRQRDYDRLSPDVDAQAELTRVDRNDQYAANIGGASNWDAHNGYYATVNSNHDWGLSYFAQQDWNAAYKDASTEAELDDLADYYGAWTEYTFYAAEEMYADFSFRAGVAPANYNAYRATPAGEGNPSPTVAGEGVNFINQYGGTYRIFVDDEPVLSSWEKRPPVALNSLDDYANMANWITLVDEDARAVNNNYNAQIVPAPSSYTNSARPWDSATKKEIADELKAQNKIDDATYELLAKPDFCDVHLTKGRHTLKVQGMGGQTAFDAIVVNAHKDQKWTPTGIEAIGADKQGAVDENAPVEYFNLQGVRVENPSNGIFIRRQGTQVTKVAIR